MNDIQPKPFVTEKEADSFMRIYKESGDLLKNATELPRLEVESGSAYAALIDYYLMGYGRSYVNLAKYYQTQESPPTKSLPTIKTWSHRYNWTERIQQYEETIVEKQLAVLENARMQFIGKQVNVLYLLEEAIVKSAAHVDMEDINLGQFARAIEKFATVTQKVFDMQPTIRVSHVEESGFKGMSAREGMSKLGELVDIMKEREKLGEIIDGEYAGAEEIRVGE